MRSDVLMLIAAAAFLPIVYLGVLYYYRECFTQECNKKRRFLRSMPEIIVLVQHFFDNHILYSSIF